MANGYSVQTLHHLLHAPTVRKMRTTKTVVAAAIFTDVQVNAVMVQPESQQNTTLGSEDPYFLG